MIIAPISLILSFKYTNYEKATIHITRGTLTSLGFAQTTPKKVEERNYVMTFVRNGKKSMR